MNKFLLLFLVSGLFFGCQSKPSNLPQTAGDWKKADYQIDGVGIARGLESTDPLTHHILWNDDKSVATVVEGDILVVELQSNPTTGFDWVAKSFPKDILKFRERIFVKFQKDALVGSGGHTRLVFDVIGSGKGEINVSYERSWEKNSAEKTKTFSFISEKRN